MHTRSNNVEIMVGSETNVIIIDLFESFLQKYQEGLEESMRGSEFVYDSVDVLCYNLNKVSLSRGGSYTDSPKWLKNKEATINPQIKIDDRCFQYAVTDCFQSYTTKNKLKMHKKICENHDYCYVEMPEEYNKIIKYNEGDKSMKSPFIIYADLESLLEKMNTYHNNP